MIAADYSYQKLSYASLQAGALPEYPEPDECKTIDAITDLLIGHLKIQYRDQSTLRDTHTKSNGLVKASLQVLPDLPDELCDVYHALQEFRLAQNHQKRIDVLTSTPSGQRDHE